MIFNILAFALGMVLLQQMAALPPWPGQMLAGAVGLAAVLRCCRIRKVILARGLWCLCWLALGFSWAAWRADVRLADQLGATWEGQDVQLVGTIAGLPQPFANGQRFELDVNTVLSAGAVVPRHLMLSWYRGREDEGGPEQLALVPGQVWQLTVRLKRPHGNANPLGFDYEAWLLERNIRATGYVRPAPPRLVGEASAWHPGYAIEALRQGIRSRFLTLLPEADYPYGGILVALVMGDQRAIHGGD